MYSFTLQKSNQGTKAQSLGVPLLSWPCRAARDPWDHLHMISSFPLMHLLDLLGPMQGQFRRRCVCQVQGQLGQEFSMWGFNEFPAPRMRLGVKHSNFLWNRMEKIVICDHTWSCLQYLPAHWCSSTSHTCRTTFNSHCISKIKCSRYFKDAWT